MATKAQLDEISWRGQFDLLNMVVGDRLGGGCSRDVFVNDLNPLQVVKFEHGSHFANVQEWLIWQEVKETPELAKWFAPCDFISPDGKVLIQRRTQQPKIAYPIWVPKFFTDLKLTNWGELEGVVVCHDYAMLARFYTMESHRYKMADWWRLESLS